MYLDPGFGGMLIQAIVVMTAVGGGILYSLRRKIKALFTKGEKKMERPKLKQNSMSQENNVIDPLKEDK